MLTKKTLLRHFVSGKVIQYLALKASRRQAIGHRSYLQYIKPQVAKETNDMHLKVMRDVDEIPLQ